MEGGGAREGLPSKGESWSVTLPSFGGEAPHDIAEVVEGLLESIPAPSKFIPASVGGLKSIFESCIVLDLMSSSVCTEEWGKLGREGGT